MLKRPISFPAARAAMSPCAPLAVRVCRAYMLVLLGTVLAVPVIYSGREFTWFFQERGLVEWTQAAHLAVATILLGCAALIAMRRGRRTEMWFLLIFATGTLWALHRECDFFWKGMRLKTTYAVLKFGLLAPAVVIGVACFRALWPAVLADPRRPVFVCMYLGVGGYALAQLASTGVDVMGAARMFRRATQEATELAAGCFLLFAGVQALRAPLGVPEPVPVHATAFRGQRAHAAARPAATG